MAHLARCTSEIHSPMHPAAQPESGWRNRIGVSHEDLEPKNLINPYGDFPKLGVLFWGSP